MSNEFCVEILFFVLFYQSLCAVCGSNLAELNPSVYSVVPPYVADVTVNCALCRNQINEHYYYYYYYHLICAIFSSYGISKVFQQMK